MATEPKTAEERVELVNRYTVMVGHVRVSRHTPEDTQRAYDALVEALQSMHDDTREATVREVCGIIDSIRIVSQRDGSVHYSANPIEAVYAETGVTP